MNQPIHKWTMAVDMDKCTGCNACMVACHAENNVPVQTAVEVAKGRGMHWIHLERYWDGSYPAVRASFLPMLCQQCGRAPCEPVCPVYATNHSPNENLNLQIYNRCVGTRYCQNNDPYKVRFFNFFDPTFDAPLTEQLNPDVTVRTAGIMEKCTFCIQRIRRTEEDALAKGLPVKDGDVQPACVQTCPPSALLFGDLNDPNSQISILLKDNSRKIRILEELGTEPSIYYLKGGQSYVTE
jgi:molybdopterin-containing oxidoreductase family iron-sulfur binding subunit